MTINTIITAAAKVLKSVSTSTGEVNPIDVMSEAERQDALITLQALSKIIDKKQAEIKATLPDVAFIGTFGVIAVDVDVKYAMDIRGALLACRERGFDITDALSITQTKVTDKAALALVQSFRSVESEGVKKVVRLDKVISALLK